MQYYIEIEKVFHRQRVRKLISSDAIGGKIGKSEKE
jgi:hypothetical protein